MQGLGGNSQAASPSLAAETFCTTDGVLGRNGGWPGGRNTLFFQEFELFREFSLFLQVWQNPRVPRLLLRDRLRNWLLGGEKNGIVYSLFCI